MEAALLDARSALHAGDDDTEPVLDSALLRAGAPAHPPVAADAARAAAVLADVDRFVAELDEARARVSRELQLHRRLAAGREHDHGPVYLDGRC